MSDRLDQLDYYTLLGVAPGANADAIREAFHTFALKFHPDNHGGTANEARATQIFRRGTEAYRVLRDPAKRKSYDETLKEGNLRLREDQARPKSSARKKPLNRRAQPFFVKAEQAFKKGQKGPAKLNLNIALQHEPDHPKLLALKAKIEEL